MTPFTAEPHQVIARDFLASRYHAALGDQRGLGKTVSAILAAEKIGAKHVLVTCPASIRSNWHEHLRAHFGSTQGWDVISYHGASDDFYRLALRQGYDLWIGDEIHHCKSTESMRSRAIFGPAGLARRARYKWVLSGTLAPNGRPVELYPLLKTLCPAFRDYSFGRYTQEFCNAYFDGRERNVKGASQIEKFTKLLDGFLLRRTKKEVYPNRKEPIIIPVPVELSSSALYAIQYLEDEIGGREARISSSYEHFSQMGDTSRLLHALGEAMALYASQFICELLESEDKVVVFAHHLDVIHLFVEWFQGRGFFPVVYRGGMSDQEKECVKTRFMRDPACRVFIGQRQAAGEGINGLQTVCSTCIVAEPSWVPKDDEQNVGRLDRMGQEGEVVTAYFLYAVGTLSKVVVDVNAKKARIGTRLGVM